MYSCTTLDGTHDFRSPELNTLVFPLSFPRVGFLTCCSTAVCDVLQLMFWWWIVNVGVLVHVNVQGQGFVYEWHLFVFLAFPQARICSAKLLSQKLWEVCSGWLPLLCVLSLPRWERGAVLLWKPWVPLCTWLRSTPSVPCKPGEYVKGYLLLLCLAAQHAHWNCCAWLIPRSRDAAKGT